MTTFGDHQSDKHPSIGAYDQARDRLHATVAQLEATATHLADILADHADLKRAYDILKEEVAHARAESSQLAAGHFAEAQDTAAEPADGQQLRQECDALRQENMALKSANAQLLSGLDDIIGKIDKALGAS